ncbi:hypothetical protein PIB30_101761, partial [Stylosanthes scabra]|nr:hypothetical protein [Stylosanthes scabra]
CESNCEVLINDLSYRSLRARMGGAGVNSDTVDTSEKTLTTQLDGLFDFAEYLGLSLLGKAMTYG